MRLRTRFRVRVQHMEMISGEGKWNWKWKRHQKRTMWEGGEAKQKQSKPLKVQTKRMCNSFTLITDKLSDITHTVIGSICHMHTAPPPHQPRHIPAPMFIMHTASSTIAHVHTGRIGQNSHTLKVTGKAKYMLGKEAKQQCIAKCNAKNSKCEVKLKCYYSVETTFKISVRAYCKAKVSWKCEWWEERQWERSKIKD